MNDRRLVVPLMIIMALMAFSVAAKASREPESKTQAHAAAEAGLAWAYKTLVATPQWDDLLSTAGANGVALATDAAMPGGSGAGRYRVVVRNDSRPGDDGMTGVAVDPGGHTTDTNGHVVVDVTGAVGDTRRTLSAVVRRIVLPPIPAVVSFPGSESQAAFGGDAWAIDGNDVRMDGSAGSCAPRYAIAVATPANEMAVENMVLSQQKDNVRGRTPSMPAGIGDGAIASDGTLTPSALATFVREASGVADIKARSTVHAAVTYRDVGATCASHWGSPTCWGTPERPKIVYVKGEPDATSGVAALQLNGSVTGYGILIVEDGDLRVTGTLDWNGLIIVTGQFIGVGFLGGANTQTVHGAVIANETGSAAGLYEGVVLQGNATLRYSCEAIDLARAAAPLTTLIRTAPKAL